MQGDLFIMLVCKTTQKEVKNSFTHVLSVSYEAAYYLLRYQSRIAYTANSYGWRADVYDFGAVAVVTGYSPFGHSVNYERLREYEKQAEKIATDYNGANARERINALLKAWILDETNTTDSHEDSKKPFLYIAIN